MKEKLTLKGYLSEKGIDREMIREIEPFFRLREYKKGHTLLNMGENTKVVCLILQGIVRGVYIDTEGTEITKCFSKEGDWCCIYNLIRGRKSEYWIEALEDCQVAEIAVEKIDYVLDAYRPLQALYHEVCHTAIILMDEKGVSFQKMQARERYHQFSERYPDMEKRVKQEYIASYLGITPSSLSRIKRMEGKL